MTTVGVLRTALCMLLGMLAGSATAATPEETVRDAMAKLAPQVKIDVVQESSVPGFHEAIVGSQFLYISKDGRYVLDGSAFDAVNQRDLTEGARARQRLAGLARIGSDQRIVFAPAKATRKVTVFTDIDCGYCRKMHSHIAEYNERGIQVDYLFFPRSGPGTPSFDKAVSVWCAKDRKSAFTSAKAGQDPSPLKCDNPIAQEYQLGMTVGVDGTPAVYAPDGSRIGGYLTPDQLQASLDRIAAAGKPGA